MKKVQIDSEKIKSMLGKIVKNVVEKEDPHELDAYRRIFKSNVSIFRRAYVAAYLLKHFNGGGLDLVQRRGSNISDNMRTLYIGIGKSRNVLPRDFINMIIERTGAKKDDVGSIKILDNYTFLEVSAEKAAEVVKSLNGIVYKGRTLNVSFAKKKLFQ